MTAVRRLEGHARARQAGRAAAAAHLFRGSYLPRPGVVVAVDRLLDADGQRRIAGASAQDRARARVSEVLARQTWRPERCESTAAMLEAMVNRMDRETGLVTIVRAELGAVAARSDRTVSALWAWAQRSGLLVLVESGASAEALGADRNRAATFAFTEDSPTLEDDHCNPPGVLVTRSSNPQREHEKQLRGGEDSRCVDPASRRLRRDRLVSNGPWPARDVPTTVAERQAAAERLFDDLRLIGRARRRAHRALLAGGYWDAETACPAALQWAVHHHPDDPGPDRGDPFGGAVTDPLRVLLARLAPWRGRLDEPGALPERVRGVDRAARIAATAAREASVNAAMDAPEVPARSAPVASSSIRGDRMAEIRATLAARANTRGGG